MPVGVCTQICAELLGGYHRVEAGRMMVSDLGQLHKGASEESLELKWTSSRYGKDKEPSFLKEIPVSVHYFGDEKDYRTFATKVASGDNELHGVAMKPTFADLVHLVHRQR